MRDVYRILRDPPAREKPGTAGCPSLWNTVTDEPRPRRA
jgi:hypothetical protein